VRINLGRCVGEVHGGGANNYLRIIAVRLWSNSGIWRIVSELGNLRWLESAVTVRSERFKRAVAFTDF
jgi:hypothetical protein